MADETTDPEEAMDDDEPEEPVDPERERFDALYEELVNLYTDEDYDGAEAKSAEALECAAKLAEAGDEEPMAIALNLLGGIKRATGDIPAALDAQTKSLEIMKRVRDEDDYDLAGAYENVASLLHAAGRHAEAVTNYTKALDLKREIVGADNPDLSTTILHMAEATGDSGDVAGGEALMEEALKQAMNPPGLETLPMVARVYAGYLHESDRAEEAGDVLLRATRQCEAWLSEAEEPTNAMNFSLARLEVMKHEYALMGYGPKPVVELQESLAAVLSELDRPREAIRPAAIVAKALRRQYGAEHAFAAQAYLDLGELWREVAETSADPDDWARAETAFRVAMTGMEEGDDAVAALDLATLEPPADTDPLPVETPKPYVDLDGDDDDDEEEGDGDDEDSDDDDSDADDDSDGDDDDSEADGDDDDDELGFGDDGDDDDADPANRRGAFWDEDGDEPDPEECATLGTGLRVYALIDLATLLLDRNRADEARPLADKAAKAMEEVEEDNDDREDLEEALEGLKQRLA